MNEIFKKLQYIGYQKWSSMLQRFSISSLLDVQEAAPERQLGYPKNFNHGEDCMPIWTEVGAGKKRMILYESLTRLNSMQMFSGSILQFLSIQFPEAIFYKRVSNWQKWSRLQTALATAWNGNWNFLAL